MHFVHLYIGIGGHMKRVTIQEIAGELGLSRNTVSKALSGSDAVAPETRLQVIRTACEMGYPQYRIKMPEETASELLTTRQMNVLVLSKRETSNFWNRIIIGISDILNAQHISLQLKVISDGDMKDHVLPFEEQDQISGIIVMSVFDTGYIDRLMEAGIPTVFLDSPVHCELYLRHGDVIMAEGYHSMRALTEQLIRQGLSRFCFIGDTTYCRSIADRYEGFRAALTEHGISERDQLLYISHSKNRYYDMGEISQVIDSFPYIPDAILCSNDDIAKDVYSKLRSIGLQIPKDISITGFDDSEAAEILSPSLTTVAVHNQSMGRRLASQLLERMGNPEAPKELIYVSTDLLIRESSMRRKAY